MPITSAGRVSGGSTFGPNSTPALLKPEMEVCLLMNMLVKNLLMSLGNGVILLQPLNHLCY
jgi:hypothetical protein